MRCEIKDAGGKLIGVWVAKTSRGFSKKQLRAQEAARDLIRRSFNGIVSLGSMQEYQAKYINK